MSEYVQWLNEIKLQATTEWLTDGQRVAFDALCTRWPAAPFICLQGNAGSGKTFIARLLATNKGYHYCQTLNDVPAGIANVILDGEGYSRMIRSQASLLSLKRVIVLSSRPPSDSMPNALIVLTERDRMQFLANITRSLIIKAFRSTPEGTDFSRILRIEAIVRGGNPDVSS